MNRKDRKQNKNSAKRLSMLLSICLLAAMLPQSVFSQEETQELFTEKHTEAVTEAAAVKSIEPATEASVEKPAEPATEAPAEKPTEAVTEAPAQKPTENTTEASSEQQEGGAEISSEQMTEDGTEAPAETDTEPMTKESEEGETETEVSDEKPKKAAAQTKSAIAGLSGEAGKDYEQTGTREITVKGNCVLDDIIEFQDWAFVVSGGIFYARGQADSILVDGGKLYVDFPHGTIGKITANGSSSVHIYGGNTGTINQININGQSSLYVASGAKGINEVNLNTSGENLGYALANFGGGIGKCNLYQGHIMDMGTITNLYASGGKVDIKNGDMVGSLTAEGNAVLEVENNFTYPVGTWNIGGSAALNNSGELTGTSALVEISGNAVLNNYGKISRVNALGGTVNLYAGSSVSKEMNIMDGAALHSEISPGKGAAWYIFKNAIISGNLEGSWVEATLVGCSLSSDPGTSVTKIGDRIFAKNGGNIYVVTEDAVDLYSVSITPEPSSGVQWSYYDGVEIKVAAPAYPFTLTATKKSTGEETLKYQIEIPPKVSADGGTINLDCSMEGKGTVTVSVSSEKDFRLVNTEDSSAAISYSLKKQGETEPLTEGSAAASFTASGSQALVLAVNGTDSYVPSGNYTDTLTFSVSTE
ncbi:hypothetical protein BRYFOR_08283 [Marvinbryantia formatexigens DSM 14469]|uniref:Uncharacterized protein n=1 Tax=Marvinbryantia formatexigens DSM 14469 TaxID=478749 RepID=C6LI12_9FIRM|nr:hypothetical protein [Marvinbryantia formatexigens]EET59667.1 hypothetical protein BRYFOR_08283 [Marvinbryantia formatexigens DSM 14469]UWO26672.1 hypothetical protein NQ534_09525 [Marvinbryantia formatexigens DSM 14469]SDG44817.1 hypothetical protein SAMN05660368_02583 [Marvinbryantia formatexigens]